MASGIGIATKCKAIGAAVKGFVSKGVFVCGASAALLAGCNAGSAPQLPALPMTARMDRGDPVQPNHVLGLWRGTLTQGNSKTFKFSIHVKSDVNHTLTGTSRISAHSEWGVMSFTATVKGKTIDYTETKILRQRITGGAWCIKSAVLQLSDAHRVMQGPWQANNCVPGEIDVTRP